MLCELLAYCRWQSAQRVCHIKCKKKSTHVIWIRIISAKEIMFLVAFFCLSVCFFVSNITQKVMKRIAMQFYGGSRVAKRTSYHILVEIWITMRPWWHTLYPPCLDRGAGNDSEALGLLFHHWKDYNRAWSSLGEDLSSLSALFSFVLCVSSWQANDTERSISRQFTTDIPV